MTVEGRISETFYEGNRCGRLATDVWQGCNTYGKGMSSPPGLAHRDVVHRRHRIRDRSIVSLIIALESSMVLWEARSCYAPWRAPWTRSAHRTIS
ncbi:MAG: hypothetical protein D6723_03170 [Acidobacteria bacterium]|nr:MAG: hypothetical protein D6723_03170 [Acidobacteriota bacterium]